MELSAEQKKQLEEQKKHCPFCKIIRGEIPTNKVYEDNKVVVITDINPFKEGHLLVVPKEHYPVLALAPASDTTHIYKLLPEFCKYLKKALLKKYCSVFVANGAAAGQQAGHFMIHLIPSDSPIPQFSPTTSNQSGQKYQEIHEMLSHNLSLMIQKNAQSYPMDTPSKSKEEVSSSQSLAELLEENPEFKEMLINKPEAVIAGLDDNPSLKPLFEGVDVHELSKQLKQQRAQEEIEPAQEQESQKPPVKQDTPRAVDLSNQQLRAYLNDHERLKEYLLTNQEVLAEALKQQPKLQVFFEDTSIQEVANRITHVPSEDASLEDLAGGTN